MPDEEYTSGYSDLVKAFSETPPEPVVAEPEALETPAPEVVTPKAEDIRAVDVLTSPQFSKQVDREVKSRLEQAQEADKQRQYQNWVESLPDDEYGRLMRVQQVETARYAQTRDAVAGKFAEEATRDVLTQIDELGKLSVEEAEKLDPAKFASYGKWVAEVANITAERRADARVAAKLDKEREAIRVEERASAQKAYPKQPTGGGGAVSTITDMTKVSGRDLLRSYFAREE